METTFEYKKIKDKPNKILVIETTTYEDDIVYYQDELIDRQNKLATLKSEIPVDKLTVEQIEVVEKENEKIRNERIVLELDRDILTTKIAAMEAAKEIVIDNEVIK